METGTLLNPKPHPSLADFDPLVEEEDQRLEKSIVGTQGAVVPVLVWKGEHNIHWLMDGKHRVATCKKHKLPFSVKVITGTEAAAKMLARSLNEDRRHRPVGVRAMAAAEESTAKEGRPKTSSQEPVNENMHSSQEPSKPKTTAQAAKKHQVSVASVKRAKVVVKNGCKELKQALRDKSVDLKQAAKLASKDHDAQRKALAKIKYNRENPKAKREPGDEPDAPKDHFKIAVPDGLHKAFGTIEDFRSINARLASLKKEIETLAEGPGARCLDGQETARLVGQAHANLRFAMPYTECVKCRRKIAKDCKHCHGSGWLNETTFKACASDADKQWMEARK